MAVSVQKNLITPKLYILLIQSQRIYIMQEILTYAIEIVFWAFIFVMIFDFINGLFPPVPMPSVKEVKPIEPEPENISLPDDIPHTKFAIPDPWLCDTEEVVKTAHITPLPPLLASMSPQIAGTLLQTPSVPKRKRGRPRKIA
ncbi:hypothetical protein VF14_08900 [Nostoc linckia z18]|nr:hypothetical protein VF06_12320 [Nostoc linckia z4]PHK12437.1 hypothetical protein VF09_03265 [Nostoc linckia z9]PHK25375.1 hypothetical protein VF10_07855 [Nostoc linckia z13]PHK35763.1 hypothetical protein VF14_08900 [Nostoc linckia z18]PHK44537.1 hypothetical protein VF13_21250 [Nostoc linckia z16]